MKGVFCVVLLALSDPLAAQYLNHPTAAIPRTADGKPNLSAPAPRTSDGKPDLSGLWGMDGSKYLLNITADLKPGDVQPWADALFTQRVQSLGAEDPSEIQCLPRGPRANLSTYLMEKFVQTPNLLVILIEDLSFRQVFLDGRQLPKDASPSFMGYSAGRWEGDTLVVESNGYNDRLWLDLGGHPQTEALRITERIRRVDFGHMEVEKTIDDPKAFNKPFTIKINATYLPDTDMLEYVVCENEKDRRHLVGKASDDKSVAAKVAPEVLAKYAGTYDFRFPENPAVPVLLHVTFSNGELLLESWGAKVPLVPLSETAFSWGGQRVEFFSNEKGVTHFTMTFAEGDIKAIRIQ